MQPLFHKLALPPILIGIHVVVLLPLFFAPPLEHPGDELLPPDAHRRTPDQPQDSFVGRLQPKFSVPFGVSGFLVVFVFKQLAGKVPLPKDPRNVRLASAIECTILFLLGVLEEIWRWGLVRILIRLQGGGGGFRGRGELWDLEKVLWNETGSMNTNYPSIWEAVYFMGWSWSVMEGVVSWWSMRPIVGAERPGSSGQSDQLRRNSGSDSTIRRPLLGKRVRSDYSIMTTDGERRDSFGTFSRKRQNSVVPVPSGLRQSESQVFQLPNDAPPVREEDEEEEEEGGPSAPYPTLDVETPSTIRPRMFDLKHGRSYSQQGMDIRGNSDSEVEEAGSVLSVSASTQSSAASTSVRSEESMPLLSSSLPYDPIDQHPHHEEQAAIQNKYRQTSYSTLNDSIAISSAVGDDATLPDLQETDDEEGISPHDRSVSDSMLERGQAVRPEHQRAYPSFPSYSTSYNHIHFSPPPNSTASPTLAPQLSPGQRQRNRLSRRIYGVSVNDLQPFYPVIWRTTTLLLIVSHGLLFAWTPTLVFRGHFQWWCFLILVLIAGKRGWYTLEWWGGGASRDGLLRVSIMFLFLSILLYGFSLAVWGILW